MIFDKLGSIIKEGVDVLILKTPVTKKHEFTFGKIVKITGKTVHVHVPDEDVFWRGEFEEKIYKRYPEQIVVIKKVD